MKAASLETEKQRRFLPAEQADIYRLEISGKLTSEKKRALGQYLTSLRVAAFMSSFFNDPLKKIVLFDPGAGTGTLTAAFIQEMMIRNVQLQSIQVECFELEPMMLNYLESTLRRCAYVSKTKGISFFGISYAYRLYKVEELNN